VGLARYRFGGPGVGTRQKKARSSQAIPANGSRMPGNHTSRPNLNRHRSVDAMRYAMTAADSAGAVASPAAGFCGFFSFASFSVIRPLWGSMQRFAVTPGVGSVKLTSDPRIFGPLID
jgi:hypothetical protein